jgi:hypothetical protein
MVMCLETLLNGEFSNGSAIFLGLIFALTFDFLLQSITFSPADCPSHRSLIPIQRSKNKNLKIEISQIINHFSSIFIYKKRDEKEQREKEGRKKREKR